MGTLLDLKTRIAQDLSRTDLTTPIANAITDAVKFYERRRFWFNTSRNLSFATVASQVAYDGAALTTIPNIVRIDALYLKDGTSIYPLTRREPVDFELLEGGSTGPGRPCDFTYIDKAIRLWPVPNAVWQMRLHAHYKLPALTGDDQTNAWTDDAEELIRSHAKLLLFLDKLQDDEGAARMQAKIPVLLSALQAETSARSSTGIIQGTDF